MPKKIKAEPNTNRTRPPVITVMGHVDHGKTTLLDAFRKTNLTDKESGGITQHIGAYQIFHEKRKITFIDTPGHVAFDNMRARGVKAADLVVLVIDAVESVKAQTKECLKHIKKAKIPFLVAINKIDLPNATPDIVRKDLADNNVLVEDFSGDIVSIPISAKTGKNLDDLLEMILLISDMQNLKANTKGRLEAITIESYLDKRRGVIANIIIKNGTIKIGQTIFSNQLKAKVKALFNENNEHIQKAIPGQPVQVLGFNQTLEAGSIITDQPHFLGKKTTNPKQTNSSETKEQSLPIIIRADTVGTLEAITKNLENNTNIITKGVGPITESDVVMAEATKANIIAFRVKTPKEIQKLAELSSVLIKTYKLIHKLLKDIQKQILELLEPTINETILGEAKIIAKFTVQGKSVAGCRITSGKFNIKDKIHLQRNNKHIDNSKVQSISQQQTKLKQIKQGNECGIIFTKELNFQENDKIIAYQTIL